MQIIDKINNFFFTLHPNVPLSIVSKTKTYNMANLIQCQELFGIGFIPAFKATVTDVQVAKKIYNEFTTVKDGIDPNKKNTSFQASTTKGFQAIKY